MMSENASSELGCGKERDVPMTCGSDEVEEDVNAVVTEAGITLDS